MPTQPRVAPKPLPTAAWAGYLSALVGIARATTAIMRRTVLKAIRDQQRLAAQYKDRDDPDEEEERRKEEEARAAEQSKEKRAAAQARPSLREGAQLPLPMPIRSALGEFDEQVRDYTVSITMPKILGPAGQRIVATNERAQVSLAGSLGLRVVEPGTELAKAAEKWTAENAALIKSQPEEIRLRVRELVEKMVPAGSRWETIAAKLVAEEGIAVRKAALIARDQTSKYNSALTKIRQTAVGITHYEWRGVMDSRERPSHVALQGDVFAWDTPPPVGHPGEPIQCRCQAVPVTTGRGIAKARELTPEELVDRVAALGPTQKEGPDATPAMVRARAEKEVAGDIRLAKARAGS